MKITEGEIDIILNKKETYEVKLNPEESDVKKPKEMSMELKLDGFKIVSKNYIELENVVYAFMMEGKKEEKVENKKIKFIPLWKWLLDIKV